MKITKQELDNLFASLLAYTDLKKVAQTVNLFTDDSLSEEDILATIKELYNRLCVDIADKEISDQDLPIGHGLYGMMLAYNGGEPAIILSYEMAEAYEDEKD